MKASTASLILALSAASPSVAIPPVPPVAATSTTDTATASYTSLGALPGDGSTSGFSSAAKSSSDISSIPPTPHMPEPTHSHLMANQSTVITLSEHYRTVVVSIGVENTTARHMHEKERLRNELDGDGQETGFSDRDPARTDTEDYVGPKTKPVHPHGYFENKDGHHFKDLETLRGRLKMAIRLALDPKRLRDMLRFERERRRDRKLDGGPWGNQTFRENKGRLPLEEGTLPMWNATMAHAPGPVVGPAMDKDY